MILPVPTHFPIFYGLCFASVIGGAILSHLLKDPRLGITSSLVGVSLGAAFLLKWPLSTIGLSASFIFSLISLVFVSSKLREEEKLEKWKYYGLVSFSVFYILFMLFPPSFLYFWYRGETGRAYFFATLFFYLSLISLIIGLSFTLVHMPGISLKRATEKQRRKEKVKIKNPFKEIVKLLESEFGKVVIGLIFLPILFSLNATLILIHDTMPIDVRVTKYNFTIEKKTSSATVLTISLPQNVSEAEVEIIAVFEGGSYYQGKKVIYPGETTVVDIRGKIKGAPPAIQMKALFSRMGIYNFWIPTMLVFLISYTLLESLFPRGEEKRKIPTDVKILLAFSIAIIFGGSSFALRFVTTYLPYLGILIVFIVFLMAILAVVFPQFPEYIRKPGIGVKVSLAALIIFTILLAIFAALKAAGYSTEEIVPFILKPSIPITEEISLSILDIIILVIIGILIAEGIIYFIKKYFA